MISESAHHADAPVTAYAHRGVHVATGAGSATGADAGPGAGPAPGENTAGAVRAAATLGYRWVETDVRATSDGEVVLAHDPDLARVTGLDAASTVIADHTLAQLTDLAQGAGYDLTTLEDASDAAPGVELNIDVKAPTAVPGVVALATRRPELVARWRVTSFSESTRSAVVRALREVPGAGAVRTSASAPLALVALVVAHAPLPRRLRGAGLAALADVTGLDSLQLPPTATVPLPGALVRVLGPLGDRLQQRLTDVRVVDAALVDAAHRGGVQVHVWTVDDPALMAALADVGVDAIITDEPSVLADVLRARGQPWPQGPAAGTGSGTTTSGGDGS